MDWTSCLSPEGVATLSCIPIVFQNVVKWIFIFSAIAAVFFIIFAGLKFIRSGGQPKLVEDARNTLTYAIIGLIIVLLSFFIVNVISDITNVPCIKQFGFGNCK
ncbi:MAG: pilin [Patescibacteria group bacterium]|nr:pilin [Patescibacteria group bacterium]